MYLHSALLALPLMLAACGSGGGTAGAPTAPANSVAAAPAPAGQKWTDVVNQSPEGGYVIGNPNAAIKLVEYGSRTCPTCGAFGQTGMRPLEETYVATGKVSYEFRDFLIHAPDLGVATLGRCAGKTPFFPILEQMFVDQPGVLTKLETLPAGFQERLQTMTPAQQATAWVEYLGYIDWMKQRGVPEAQLRACLADTKGFDSLARITETAMQEKNVQGTPSFFLNGRQLENTVSWPDVEKALKAAGA